VLVTQDTPSSPAKPLKCGSEKLNMILCQPHAALNTTAPKRSDGLRKWVLIKKAREKLDLNEVCRSLSMLLASNSSA
jgi:hypothetical protein